MIEGNRTKWSPVFFDRCRILVCYAQGTHGGSSRRSRRGRSVARSGGNRGHARRRFHTEHLPLQQGLVRQIPLGTLNDNVRLPFFQANWLHRHSDFRSPVVRIQNSSDTQVELLAFSLWVSTSLASFKQRVDFCKQSE